jgi:hypothetical protein
MEGKVSNRCRQQPKEQRRTSKTAQDARTGGLSSIACVLRRDGFDTGWTDEGNIYNIKITNHQLIVIEVTAELTMSLRVGF